jgi:hypothetical protein
MMRIDLVKINMPEDFDLAGRLTQIHCLPHEGRNRERDRQIMRLEVLEKRGHFWLCDFVKVRMDHGPGKAALDKAITGFNLKEKEGFGEETALLWDTKTNYCVIQYNHHGPRDTSIAEYIAFWERDSLVDFSFAPKLDDSIHAKLRKKKIVRKFTLSCAPKKLSNADYETNTSLSASIASLGQTDADLIHITVSVSGSKDRSLNFSLPAISDWIQRVGGSSKDSPVKAARATAKGNETEASEVLDLLHHRITTEKAVSPGKDKRYSLNDRWALLQQAYYEWKSIITA